MKLITKRLHAVLLPLMAAATTAVGVSSCATADEEPAMQGETTVRLALAVGQGVSTTRTSSASAAATRSSYTEVQAGENAAAFLGFADLTLIPFSATAGDKGAEPVGSALLPLSTPFNSGAQSTTLRGANSQVYDHITVPVGTRSYLVYARGGSQTTGDLVADLSGLYPETYRFAPKPIVAAADKATATATGQRMADYLSAIANASGWAASSDELYTKFVSMHAGASANVQTLVQDLYSQKKDGTDAVSTAIRAAILSATYGVADANSDGVLEFPAALSGYPASAGLPDGAAAIEWNSTDSRFDLSETLSYSTLNVADIGAYVRPAPLYYRANSLIATDPNGDKTTYYNNLTQWDYTGDADKASSILGQYTALPGTVTDGTRSMAIVRPLQYAVARLDLKVVAGSTSLADADGQHIDVGTTSFPVTGVLVAGQRVVDWQFQPVDAAEEHIVYDGHLTSSTGTAVSLASSNFASATPLYTLLFESKAAATVDEVLNVAVEFRNDSGQDFVGAGGGVVAKGTKFYLVAQLKPYDKGASHKAFEQDKKTALNLTVASLENAFNIIPNLKDQKLPVGMTVESWTLSTPTSVEL